jgi:vancomycin permeability regulator SanA
VHSCSRRDNTDEGIRRVRRTLLMAVRLAIAAVVAVDRWLDDARAAFFIAARNEKLPKARM